MNPAGPASLSGRLREKLLAALAEGGGWLPFERFMAIALYEPGLGYYMRGEPILGRDFVTAPELSPFFGRALARQVDQALQALQAADAAKVIEFGAGSGALAAQVLQALGDRVGRYTIVELSGALRARQAERLAPFGDRVRWLDRLPDRIEGVVLGNEVLDAMPVVLLHWDGERWLERGVVVDEAGRFAWHDRPTALHPPGPAAEAPWPAGTLTEIHPQAEAFVRTLAERLVRGAAFFVDYGFPEAEYYHPQRSGGTLMCHRAQRADPDPLADVGDKDITAHVNFSAIALAAQDAGLDVIGYTTQAHFLLNCGLLELLAGAGVREVAHAQKLLNEHEMGELFKVIGLARGITLDPIGFARGDRSHTL